MASGKRKIENGADAMSSPLKQARADSSAAAELKTADELSAPLVDGAGGDSITCLHEVSYPENYEMPEKAEPLLNKKPAKEYPFTLDPFQREAIKCLEAGESVLVSDLFYGLEWSLKYIIFQFSRSSLWVRFLQEIKIWNLCT